MKKTPLKRREPISKKHRRTKGANFEREVMEVSKHVWPDIRRNFMSGAQGGSDFTGTPGFGLEAKFHETTKPWEWYEQAKEAASATETAVVVFKRSRSAPMALLSYEDLLGLIEEAGS